MTRRTFVLGAISIMIFGIAAVLILTWRAHLNPKDVSATLAQNANSARSRSVPTLYCDFYNFMHNTTVVSFYFSVDLGDRAAPKFTELYVGEPDGTKTDFGNENGSLPQWIYKIDDRFATIESSDSAIEIVLYGIKPNIGGTLWVEAGLRSNEYRNLEGKCCQANFGEASKSDLLAH